MSGILIYIYYFFEMFGGLVIIYVKFLYSMNLKEFFRDLYKKFMKKKVESKNY